MKENNIYTMQQWAADKMFSAQPGQFVEDAVYYQLLDSVPPRSDGSDYMQVGEAYGTCPKTGKNTYTTFVKENGMWKFIGNVPYGEGRPQPKTFHDLEFKPHPISEVEEKPTHFQAVMHFPNGYGVSVVLGTMFYSNGVDTYEVAILKKGRIDFEYNVIGDVYPRRTADEVTEIMSKVQNF